MDNLSKCMIQCKAEGFGCHYGAWRATKGDILIVKKDEIPEGWKKCPHCGELFKPQRRKDQKYCGAYCQYLASQERVRKKRKEGAEDGQA